jgi:hypothetical protein
MKLAYADPPYFQCAVKFYPEHPEAWVYDTIEGHRALVSRLVKDYPDGWALSLGSVDLIRLLPSLAPLLPEDVRVAAWCKSFAAFKVNVNPAYTWEPVIFRGGRRGDRERLTVQDHLTEPITLRKGLTGAKPARFNRWILDLLGWQPGDQFDDLFPGTDSMSAALARADGELEILA